MRIAIAGETYLPGNNGQAIFTIHLAEGLVRAGHEVHLLTTGFRLGYQQQLVNGVHLHQMPALGFTWIHPAAYFNLLPQLMARKIFGQFRPDILHIQDHYFVSRGAALVAGRLKIPVIGTNHFLPENVLPYLSPLPLPRSLKIRVMWGLMLWTYNRLKWATTPTETAAAILRKQKIKFQVVPISCGVDTQRFTPTTAADLSAVRRGFGLDGQKTLFLYVGRHDREKRIDTLLRGAALLREQGNTAIQLVFAGQGAAKAGLQALAHTLKLDNQVTFLGYVDNAQLPDLFRTADVFCMPSPEELQSIATLEAMASGKPILAARARALPELVEPGVNGLLFEPGSAEAVAQGMRELIRRRADWAQMGAASRARAITHSLENTITRYTAVYQGVIEIAAQENANPALYSVDQA
jgi:1,2-diacylglycerol 3-alpha-glucosyltransferase